MCLRSLKAFSKTDAPVYLFNERNGIFHIAEVTFRITTIYEEAHNTDQEINIELLSFLSKHEKNKHFPVLGKLSCHKTSEAGTLESKHSSLTSN